MTKPVQVVHLLGRLEIGGAERMLLSLCREMDSSQFEHHVIALAGRSGSLTAAFKQASVTEHLCATRPFPTFPLRLFRRFRRLRPDVVVSHVSLASGFMVAVAWLARVPRRIAVFHSDGDGREVTLLRRLYRDLAKLFLRAFATDAVGVTSSALELSGLRAGGRVTTRVIANAVNLSTFSPGDRTQARQELSIEDAQLVVLHAGRAAPEKNRRILLPVLSHLPDGTSLLLAGATTTSDLGRDIRTSMSEVRDLGPVEDIRTAMAAADVLILPSIREGLPLVILEAVASGLPVVATRLPGLERIAPLLPDLHLVRPGDDPASSYAVAVIDAVAASRPPREVHATLIGSPFDLDVAVQQWTELCAQG